MGVGPRLLPKSPAPPPLPPSSSLRAQKCRDRQPRLHPALQLSVLPGGVSQGCLAGAAGGAGELFAEHLLRRGHHRAKPGQALHRHSLWEGTSPLLPPNPVLGVLRHLLWGAFLALANPPDVHFAGLLPCPSPRLSETRLCSSAGVRTGRVSEDRRTPGSHSGGMEGGSPRPGEDNAGGPWSG